MSAHWGKIEEIYQAALECSPTERAAFLHRACGGDEELRREVESLLGYNQKAGNFLEPPPAPLSALAPGRRISFYRVISKLGAGGMGEVYLAEDTRLGRHVALKVLPPDLAMDPGRKARFVREARAASALNHPNIVTVYDIGHEDEIEFLAMEYVAGKPLSALIPRQGMPLNELLPCAIQLAGALAKAHDAGIVHRDIKPGNIMMTTEGVVKVLDFGLAKLTEPPSSDTAPTQSLHHQSGAPTEEGRIVGTTAYMSPEQVEGKPVDGRSDIFSFGTVLYEMATGVRPFHGDTQISIVSAILQKDPAPVTVLQPGLPLDLERIISRCLKKDVERRFQHMDDVRVALLELKEDSESGVKAAPPARRYVRLSLRKALLAGALLCVLAAGFFWLRLRPSRAPFQHIQLQRLTTSGDVQEAAISPDGKYLARTSAQGERQTIWLRQLRTAAEIQVVSAAQTEFTGLHFSRDGEYVYYTQSKPSGRAALYKVPSLGGSPQLVLDNVTGPVAVSPDERRFGYLSRGPEKRSSIVVAGPNPADRQTILTRSEPDFLRRQLSWSPDGTLLAVPIGSVDDRFWNIERVLIVPLNGTAPAILAPVKWSWVPYVAWLPSGRALLVNGATASSRSQVWFVPYPTGEARRVTNDLNDYAGVNVTADSAAFVTVQQYELGEMWTTAAHAAVASQLTSTSANGDGSGGITWTPDGKLVYASSSFGPPDLWIANPDGANPKRLTFGGVAIAPEVAPDGRTIYFGSERGGMCHIWRIDIDGNNASQVTHGRGEQRAAVSPDGRWLLYESFSLTGPASIWKMALPSGTPVRLSDLKDASAPSISPDGQWLSVAYADERFQPPAGVGIMSLDGTVFKPLNIPQTPRKRWSPDSSALYFVKSEQGIANIWKQPISGGAPVRVTSFTSGSIGSLAVSRDERLAFRHVNSISDVVLIRSER